MPDRLDELPLSCIDGIIGALDVRKTIHGAEGYVDFVAFNGGGEILDLRRSCVDFKSRTFFFCGQGLLRRVRGRVGGYDFDGVAAIGQKRSVEGVELVGQIVFEQEPSRVAVAAVVDAVDHLVVVVIVNAPLHANGVAIMRGWRRRVEMRLLGVSGTRVATGAAWEAIGSGFRPEL